MRNCLITKLKETVNNDNLHYLGYAVLKGKAESSFVAANRQISVGSLSSVTLEIISADGYFTDNQGNRVPDGTIGFSDNARKFTYTANITPITVYLSNHNTQVKVSKYDLTNLFIGSALTCDLCQLSYAGINSNKFGISYTSSDDRNNIEALKYVTIDTFNSVLSDSLLYGDVGKLSFSALGSVIKMDGSACTGNLNIASGRTGTLNISNTKIGLNFDTIPITAFTAIRCGNCPNVRGTATNIINKINKGGISFLLLEGTACTGTIEQIIEGLYGTTRTASSLYISLSDSMTFNGNTIGHLISVTFDSTVIRLTDEVTHAEIASYDGTTWTYA